MSSSWKDYIVNFGKHKGWTMFQVYVNDYQYILWMKDNITFDKNNATLKKAIDSCIEHKNLVDPFAR